MPKPKRDLEAKRTFRELLEFLRSLLQPVLILGGAVLAVVAAIELL